MLCVICKEDFTTRKLLRLHIKVNHPSEWPLLKLNKGYKPGTHIAWNKGLTQQSDARVKLGTDSLKRTLQERRDTKGYCHEYKPRPWARKESANENGYKYQYIPCSISGVRKKTKRDHITVAESLLGRKLKNGECVHHKDENRQNNDPSNIMVFRTRGDHTRYHNLVRAGEEFQLEQNDDLSFSCKN